MISGNPLSTLPLSSSAPGESGPLLQNRTPEGAGQTRVVHVTFDLLERGANIDLSSVVIRINGSIVFQNQVAVTGYIVQRTAITGGQHYDLQQQASWTPGAEVTVAVDADDNVAAMDQETWTFAASASGTLICAPGPTIPIEERMAMRFDTPALETLRKSMGGIVSADDMESHRLRGVVLIAFENDFKAVLSDLVTVPASVLRETVCQRRRLFTMVSGIVPMERQLTPALQELRSLGMSSAYQQLFETRLSGPSPTHKVSAICAMILVAAVLHANLEGTPLP